MHHFTNALRWFEIPAKNIRNAKSFYEAHFRNQASGLVLGDNLRMALFPAQQGTIGGALCEHKGFYHPGHQGPLVYLNADPDLQRVLDRVEANGGKVMIPKRQISNEFGYMAVIEDSERNRVALHSKT